MRDRILEYKIYYQQFHQTLVTWHITIAGFVFAALLAADVGDIKSNVGAVNTICVSLAVFPIMFIFAIAQYGKRIQRLKLYLSGPEVEIPDDWEIAHEKFGLSMSGAGSWYFLTIILVQSALNAVLAYCRLT